MVFTEEQSKLVRTILPPITKISKKHIHFIEGGKERKLSVAQFIKGFDASKLISIGDKELLSVALENPNKFRAMLGSLVEDISTELVDQEPETEVSEAVKNIRMELSQLIPCVNIYDPEEILLVDSEYRRSLYSAELLRTTMLREDADIYGRSLYVKFDYNPRRMERMFEEKINHQIIQCLNTYTPPGWMEEEIINPQIPPLIDKFMKHLFPIEEELEYVYDWLHKSLTDRAYVYLLLNGEKKTGKNTFKFLFKALHGLTNSVDGKKSTLTTQFNGQLAECRAFILDEIKFSEEEENVMKEIQNDNVAIERKGVDATRGSKLHCSMLLLNNDMKDNFISVDSRRFSPMTVTDKPLLHSMTEAEIGEMIGKVREDSADYDLEFVANFGHWILDNGRNLKWGKEEEYKGPKFYELVQTSLSEWRRFTLKIIEEMRRSDNGYRYKLSEVEEKFYKKLGSKSAKKYPDYGRVINFLKHYKDVKGNQMADYERVPGEYDFHIFPYYDETLERIAALDPKDDGEIDLSYLTSKKKLPSEYEDGL